MNANHPQPHSGSPEAPAAEPLTPEELAALRRDAQVAAAAARAAFGLPEPPFK